MEINHTLHLVPEMTLVNNKCYEQTYIENDMLVLKSDYEIAHCDIVLNLKTMSVPPLTHPRPKELKITDHWLADGSEFALTYVNDKGHFFVFYFQYSKKERCLHWIERRYAIKIDFNFKEQITNCTWDSAYEIIRIKQEQGNVNIVKKGKESDFYDLIDQLPRLLALS